ELHGEETLRKIFSIFTSSHYKNTPNDMKILADMPNHQIFVLSDGNMIYCAVHIAFEQLKNLGQARSGHENKSGNLLPWIIHDQYTVFNPEIGNLSCKGLRIVRIAVPGEFQGKGYGSETVNQILSHFSLKCLDVGLEYLQHPTGATQNDINPLFKPVSATEIGFVGVSTSLNQKMYKFFSKLNFIPIHIGQNINQSGEFSFSMVYLDKKNNTGDIGCPFNNSGLQNALAIQNILLSCHDYFKLKFLRLASSIWFDLGPELAFDIVRSQHSVMISKNTYQFNLHDFDQIRLAQFAAYKCDFSVVRDCIREVAIFYFMNKNLVNLNTAQSKSDEKATNQPLLVKSEELILFCIGIFAISPKEIVTQFDGLNVETVVLYLRKAVDTILKYN
ncbi:N-acetyltransferase 10, partial [Pseudoloma neurophilia]